MGDLGRSAPVRLWGDRREERCRSFELLLVEGDQGEPEAGGCGDVQGISTASGRVGRRGRRPVDPSRDPPRQAAGWAGLNQCYCSGSQGRLASPAGDRPSHFRQHGDRAHEQTVSGGLILKPISASLMVHITRDQAADPDAGIHDAVNHPRRPSLTASAALTPGPPIHWRADLPG